MIQSWSAKRSQQKSLVQGFTFLELLTVLAIIGIVLAIAAPVWQAFMNNQRLNAAQSQVHSILKEAQKSGTLKRINYQASFRQNGNRIEWVTHPTNIDPNLLSWQKLDEGVQIDSFTTFYKKQNVYRVQFNHEGAVNGQLGQMVLSVSLSSSKRCVTVSSLLGAMRTGEFDPKRRTCNAK